MVKRKKYRPKQGDPGACEGCGASAANYHRICCPLEPGACQIHDSIVRCQCGHQEGEGV